MSLTLLLVDVFYSHEGQSRIAYHFVLIKYIPIRENQPFVYSSVSLYQPFHLSIVQRKDEIIQR